jgi:Zn-finger nucleic acid-binding protein
MLTCPKCQESMRNYERNGVHVDQCNGCKGIFLDRGELEALISAEEGFDSRPSGNSNQGSYREDSRSENQQPRKKKGFLSELLDFE